MVMLLSWGVTANFHKYRGFLGICKTSLDLSSGNMDCPREGINVILLCKPIVSHPETPDEKLYKQHVNHRDHPCGFLCATTGVAS
jgi:hypothetical protein